MRTTVFILCLAFSFTAHSVSCQNLAYKLFEAAHTAGRLMFAPQRKLATRPGIEVVGSLISSKKTGEQIAKNLEDFDRAMDVLGLQKPTLTKIIVSDRTVFSLSGPVYTNKNLFNLWRRSGASDAILMQPGSYPRQVVIDPVILFHERVHSILHNTYHHDSYILSNKPIQEGLTNFLVAHYEGVPLLNTAAGPVDVNKIPPLPLPPRGNPHATGKVFSSTLWKLRERIGKEAISSLFKSFTDNLDQYRKSFKRQPNYNEIRQMFTPEYEYFLAVLKKTLQEEGKVQEADEFIAEVTTNLKLDVNTVDDIAESITKSDTPLDNHADLTRPVMHTLGTVTIATEIYLGYLAYHFLFGQ